MHRMQQRLVVLDEVHVQNLLLLNHKSIIGLAAFMHGRELSTLLSFCLSVIMGSHFQVIKLENRVFYSH